MQIFWGNGNNSAVHLCSFCFLQTMFVHTHIVCIVLRRHLDRLHLNVPTGNLIFMNILLQVILAEQLVLLKNDFSLVCVTPMGTSHLREFVKKKMIRFNLVLFLTCQQPWKVIFTNSERQFLVYYSASCIRNLYASQFSHLCYDLKVRKLQHINEFKHF